MKSNDIIFSDTIGIDSKYFPYPSNKKLPEWYKNTSSLITEKKEIIDGQTPHSIKKCMPVFDAMSAGYIIPTYVDIQVTTRDGYPYYEWPQYDAISFHPIAQAELHPLQNGAPYPKWRNPWAIKTKRGYSCLFVDPMHNPNNFFSILPGIVDTDEYNSTVNFPFVLNDTSWNGIIPAGTPMVQVIPFKRETWKQAINNNLENHNKSFKRLQSLFFNSYKRQFWQRKLYY